MGASLPQARLSSADLTGATLDRADLTGAVLVDAQLSTATLDRADLTGTDLTAANLRGASLRGANLTGTLLYRADLTGADLAGADFTQATLTEAVGIEALPPGAYADPRRRVRVGSFRISRPRRQGVDIALLAAEARAQSLVDRFFRATPTPEEVDAAVRGELWLVEQGEPVVYGLWAAAQAEYERAKAVGYIVYPHFWGHAASSAFRWWCRASQHPFVTVGVREEEADALIAMSFRNVPAGHRLAEDETQTALQLLSEYTLPDGILSPPTADPRSDGVSSAEIAIDQAEEAAARLVALWRQRRSD